MIKVNLSCTSLTRSINAIHKSCVICVTFLMNTDLNSSVVQLLAIVITKDVRKSGERVLLCDFLQCVIQMPNNGIKMHVNGTDHLIPGSLLLVVGDIPAAHWLERLKDQCGIFIQILPFIELAL